MPRRLFKILILLAAAAGLALWRGNLPGAPPGPVDPIPDCEVLPLVNEDYFPALHEALSSARRSIVCVMYRAGYDPKNPRYRETVLIEDLVAAHARGVNVEVVFDANKTFWDPAAREAVESKNREAIARLSAAGVPVFVDGLERVTHAKIVVVDEETVFLGSANWTGAALRRNHETNVRIRSKAAAARFLAALRAIERTPAR